ncbi:MAG: 50S ribosome-binding GTPase [Phycisphaerales bacterium]|nr:50S ribosome-binding GTPase [Phycisphaerales bacterium]
MNIIQRLTLPGPAALSIVRLTGAGGGAFLRRHVRPLSTSSSDDVAKAFDNTERVYRATLVDESEQPIDDIVLTVARSEPNWDVRLHLHGAPAIVALCERFAREAGFAIAAENDESSPWLTANLLRVAAERVATRMLTRAGVTWALAQPRRLGALLQRVVDQGLSEELRAALRAAADRVVWAKQFATPLRIALVGPPNAGKSTLVNRYAGRAASIVSPHAGTTRDWVEVVAEIHGVPVVFLDTAGVRETADPLEMAGIEATLVQAARADVVVIVHDSTAERVLIPTIDKPTVVILNKVDLAPNADANAPDWALPVSAMSGSGLDDLDHAILDAAGFELNALDDPAALDGGLALALREIAEQSDAASLAGALLSDFN